MSKIKAETRGQRMARLNERINNVAEAKRLIMAARDVTGRGYFSSPTLRAIASLNDAIKALADETDWLLAEREG